MEQIDGKARWLRMMREQRAAGEISKEMRDEELRIHEIFVGRVWKGITIALAVLIFALVLPQITRADAEMHLITVQGENNG